MIPWFYELSISYGKPLALLIYPFCHDHFFAQHNSGNSIAYYYTWESIIIIFIPFCFPEETCPKGRQGTFALFLWEVVPVKLWQQLSISKRWLCKYFVSLSCVLWMEDDCIVHRSFCADFLLIGEAVLGASVDEQQTSASFSCVIASQEKREILS